MPKKMILGQMFSIPDDIDINLDRKRSTEAEIMNNIRGNLTGYDCEVCRNKGVIYYNNADDELVYKPCTCLAKRKTYQRIRKSGLGNVLDRYSFDNFVVNSDYQNMIKNTAMRFVNSEVPCFFIGGQSGVGKTHICTAIMRELLNQGQSGVYMQWRTHSSELKQNINDQSYKSMIEPYKSADILYIDDLFKTRKGEKPTTSDINLAFEIINSRYLNWSRTIISSEFHLSEIIDFDEAVGGRIKEMCPGFKLDVARDRSRNYRLSN